MRITDEIKNCKELVDFDPEMIVHRIYEAWKRFDSGEKISDSDRFVLALRYSEFLANGTSSEDYVGAERRVYIYLNKIGVSHEYLRVKLAEIYNLK